MVRRLDFSVEEFVRVIWVSNNARTIWENRISSVSRMFQRLEIDAVCIGIKPIALQSCPPDQFTELVDRCSREGIFVAPLTQEGRRNFYSNASIDFDPNKLWDYRIAIGRDKTLLSFVKAFHSRDDTAIGGMLGFPACCRAFFKKYWVDAGYRDLTYPMVVNEANADNHYHVSGPTSCNILLRWLGIRRVSHLPCRFDCGSTKIIGSRLGDLAQNLYPQEAGWLHDMLEWPIRYSSLHGIAIITTPVCRIVTSTDPFSENIIIDREGKNYPDEGAVGLEFPFIVRSPVKIMKNSSKWTDSGFSSQESMTKAHETVLSLLDYARLSTIKDVIDLGSGSGALLERIRTILPVQLYGIEIDRDRFNRAMKRISGNQLILFNMDLFDYSWSAPHGLALISVNRLLESDETKRQILLDNMAKASKYLIIYSYDNKELDVSWSDYFKFIHAERVGQTIAYLLRSLHANQEDEEIGFPAN